MSNIEITLPDGSKQSVAAETRPIDIARGISPRLADAAIAAKINGEMFDLTRPIENGFYYDFDRATPFTPDDLEKIEKKMWEIQARALPYERVLTPKAEGLKKYSEAWMKCQLIEEKAGDVFTEYTLGPRFIDFCRGPHIP